MMSPLRGVLPFLAAMLFLLTACNNSDQTQTDAAAANGDSAANDTGTGPAAPANTIITTPQGMVMIKHKVKDFDAWKKAYDTHDSVRLAAGLHNYVVSRGADDSTIVMVALKADDMAKAKAFVNDPRLKAAMRKGGVTGTPSIQFINATFQDTADVGTVPRSLTTFSVKDWAEWEKSFKEGEQERIDNGITVRVYGHDPDDPNKVRLVTALVDTAKAHLYWRSDMLKQRRAASGVIGTPDLFVFHIVQRY